ncbi:MAG: hypothetical protein N2643_00015 [Endomicrobia bacterium]|nr:hypothetical protein [Endomicrobiia bacterium]
MKKFLKYLLYLVFSLYLLFLLYSIFSAKLSLHLRNTLIYIGVGIAILLLIVEIFWS